MDKPIVTMREMLKGISLALIPEKSEILLVIVFAIALLLLLLFSYWILKSLDKRRISKTVGEKYNDLIREFDLTINEIDLLDRLAHYLKFPEKKYLLLVNRGSFIGALKSLTFEQEVRDGTIASLEKKLKYPLSGYNKGLVRLSDIPRGAPVAVRGKDNEAEIFTSEGAASGKLSLSVSKTPVHFSTGDSITLYTYTYRKLYQFKSIVLSVSKDTVSVADADTVNRYTEINCILPVYIRVENLDHSPMKSTIIKFSEKGAVLKNPGKKIKRGDDLRVFFRLWLEKEFHLNCEVKKVSLDRKYLHVVFSHLKERK